MKVLCRKTLYWHQIPDYSGTLNGEEFLGERAGRPVLLADKAYEIIVCLDDNNIVLYAQGEDGLHYPIMNDSLHYESSSMALKHFNINNIRITKPTKG